MCFVSFGVGFARLNSVRVLGGVAEERGACWCPFFLTTKGSNYTNVVLRVLVSCVSFLSGLNLHA
ncbi:hypothetical protein RRSWK_06112 [Rhodopirellula sp. SWK7]|nr:hypothetical protein RRSWK_06112 [Rhodopirellula sp. SWK7]